jgi:hypothetical protein
VAEKPTEETSRLNWPLAKMYQYSAAERNTSSRRHNGLSMSESLEKKEEKSASAKMSVMA